MPGILFSFLNFEKGTGVRELKNKTVNYLEIYYDYSQLREQKCTYFPERMSCLSCKTNRYLTNIYKSQQRVTLFQPLPIPNFPS